MTGDWAAAAARPMWQLVEPLHAVTYFTRESRQAIGATGLRGFWTGYFAGRAAPLGAVTAPVVAATFFNFAPQMVGRAIPDAWSLADRPAVLDARRQGAGAALERILGPGADPAAVGRAVELLGQAVDGLDCGGRPLAAANAAQPTGPGGLEALWQLATVVREHRGDGHVATLVDAGLNGCQAHVSLAATGAVGRRTLQPNRGWEDADWAAAEAALADRGWLSRTGMLTPGGRERRRALEDATDRLAAGPWQTLGPDRTDELAAILRPLARSIWRSGDVPAENPMGLPAAG